MSAALGIYAPVILRLAADLLQQQGLTQEAETIRAIADRTDPIFRQVLDHELARPQAPKEPK